ncbi:MAG: hypothetical protein VW362_07595 [Candidatus Nanopelagicales bacterium]
MSATIAYLLGVATPLVVIAAAWLLVRVEDCLLEKDVDAACDKAHSKDYRAGLLKAARMASARAGHKKTYRCRHPHDRGCGGGPCELLTIAPDLRALAKEEP